MKTFIKILLLVTIVVGALYLVAPSVKASAISTSAECIQLTYNENIRCNWPGLPIRYTAGVGKVILTGNVPVDNSWHRDYFSLSGHLVQWGTCTMLFVEEANACVPVALTK